MAFAEEMPLGAAQYRALGPQFDRKVRGAEVVGVGIGDRDGIVEAVEGQGLAIGGLAGDPGRAVEQRASVAAARGIGQRGPAPFVHPIGGHEVGRGRRRNGRGPIRLNLGERQHAAVDADFIEQAAERIAAEQVAERHDVARTIRFQGLGGRGGEDAIHIDLQRIGAVREGHGDMVPVRIGDRAGDGVAGGEGTKRQLVGGIEIQLFTAALPEGAVAFAEEMPLGTAQYRALGPQFNRKVRGAEVVGVGIGDRDGIVEAVEGQGLAIGGLAGDPGRAVEQRASVAAARGIGQRGPAPFVHCIGGHEVGRGRRRDGRGPIRLNLGERQHAAVDADFIEQAAERIAAEQVAERHDVTRTIRFQVLGGRGGEDAIHIDLQRIGAVREGHGDMVPVRIGDRAGDGVTGAEGTKRQLVAGIEIQLFTAALPEGAVAFAEEMPLGAAQHGALGPQFNRKVRGAEVVGVGIGDRDSIVEAVEGQGLAIGGLAGDPGRRR